MSSTQNAINNLLDTTSLTGLIQTANIAIFTGGDVTAPGGSAVLTIGANRITNAMLQLASVNYNNLQNETASTLLGNPTGGSTSPSEITLGTGLAFSGTSIIASGVPTTVLTGTLQAAQFPALTGDVTTTAGSLATTIAANAVTTGKIANSAVTYAKIQNETANTFLGNPTGGAAAPSEITLGAGFSFVGGALTYTPSPDTDVFIPMPEVIVTGTTQTMAKNIYYVANNAGTCTMTLPATAAVGDETMIGGLGAGGWILAQGAGQSVNFGNKTTTVGAGGSIASLHRYDNLHIKCVVANTTWNVIAAQGNMIVT